MPTKGTSQAILVDEFIFSGDTSQITTTISTNELDTTNVNSTGMDYIPGLATWRIVQNGFFSGAAPNGTAAELHSRLGQQGAMIAHLLDKYAPESPAYVIPAGFNASLPIEAPAEGLITMSGEWAASDGGRRGLLLGHDIETDAIGGTPSIDMGSAGSAGGAAFVFIHRINGSVDGVASAMAFSVESSTSAGSGFTTLVGHPPITTTGGYLVNFNGVVNRYMRLNWTSLGGASTVHWTAVFAVRHVTG